MSSGRSLPQINLGVQGGIQGDSHTVLVNLNHSQVTRMTPELAPSFLTSTPHPQEDVWVSTDLTCIAFIAWQVFSVIGLELLTYLP
ncbi:hypothetical protein TNCV_1542101 [Trichonephila clavipes]|nr:hypothetical protein TNCV_1542101 [Trichonephila clavipes]